jgi:catechol 2,3-dioxygenase-like lactoylglutathione lyase family enzyme
VTPRNAAAHAVLHCNLNTADRSVAGRFYTEVLGMRRRMESVGTGSDASSMGITEPADSETSFLYDWRGPRQAPALEVVEWTKPRTEGSVSTDVSAVGLRAVGFSVESLATVRTALARGGRDSRLLPPDWSSGPALWTLDPDGVTVEIIESGSPGPSLSHLRLNCTNLPRSVAWYERIGFQVVAKETSKLTPGRPFGLSEDAELATASLHLAGNPEFRLELVEWVRPRTTGAIEGTGNTRGLWRAALAVDDVRMAYRQLADEGVADRDPEWIPLADTPLGGLWVLFLADPDGVVMELVERPRSELAPRR